MVKKLVILLIPLALGFFVLKRQLVFSSYSCKKCHEISPPSASHKGLLCTDCHGGDPESSIKEEAHKNMYGPKNPSDPRFWDITCAKCHFYEVQRVKSSLMYTNLGIINKILTFWEYPTKLVYGTCEFNGFSKEGKPLKVKDIRPLNHISGDLYRKFCSRCHIGIEEFKKYRGVHGSGCAACHFPYNEFAIYEGKDKTIQGKWPYSAYHRIELPSTKTCLFCHNRSARIGLSYVGLCELNNSMVPTTKGLPGPQMISGGRSVIFVKEDVHYKAGMDCIDCHTSRDTMGDGYLYTSKEDQVEIKCSDCHGTGYSYPKTELILRENHSSLIESKSYPKHLKIGTEVLLTSKNRPFSNVFYKNKKVYVIGKISGKVFECPLITNSKQHTIYGHKRLSCSCCHSLYVQQCYGCHVVYDLRYRSKDHLRGYYTSGRFREKEDFRRLYPYPLAVNKNNEVVPVVPGCQTFLTVVDKSGKLIKKEHINAYKRKSVLKFAPVVPHTTQKKTIGCKTCHSNPCFLGFGKSICYKNTLNPIFQCEKNSHTVLDGFLLFKNGEVKPVSMIIGRGARGFNSEEIRKIFSVNKCLVCHYDPEDPIYQKKLDYSRLNICLSYPYTDPYKEKLSR